MQTSRVRVAERSDAELLEDFRALFRLTLDDVGYTGISRATWARIEAGEERAHTPGVQHRLARIRELMGLVGRVSYTEVRTWAMCPLRGAGRKTPRDLVRTVPGLTYLLTYLRSREG